VGAWNDVGLTAVVTIRECRPDDVDAVLALWSEARTAHARTADRATDVGRLISDHCGSLLVADLGGELVGTVIAAWDGWRGNMYRLAVHPNHRRKRIAMQLVRAGEASLKARGARRVTALVATADETAAALWDAAGYTVDSEIGRRVRNL
jgi:ribosomal protein S18 acetylase RimI-like enzyme